MNSVIRKLSQRLSLSIPEETDIFCDMNDNVYTRHLVVKLDTTISIVTGSNMNNNNDAPARDALTTLGNQLVALLTGYMEFVDIDSILKLLHMYRIKHDPESATTENPATDLVEVTCTASPVDVTAPDPIIDVVSSTGSLNQVVAAADDLLRQLLRPVFGELNVEPVAVDLTVPPAVRLVRASVDLVGMLISLTAAFKDGRRTDPFPASVFV
ncbi:hypothetical protein GH890_29490 [Bacillus thuringiensis]|nr:hypothetical protein [Bacillus thuringiensis]